MKFLHNSIESFTVALDGGGVHVFAEDDRAILAIDAALAARRPLLIRGEPGVGKSQLARAAAQALGRAFVGKTLDAQAESRDLLYSFDAVARLSQAQMPGVTKDELAPRKFLRPGPLWWAFDWSGAAAIERESFGGARGTQDAQNPDGVVLLIDEIDKADSSVPNGLLEALGNRSFAVPGLPPVSIGGPDPLVMITTNEERTLPAPFLRRCLVLRLQPPTREQLVARGQAHFSELDISVCEEAAEQIARDRELSDDGRPCAGQAEYLDLLRAVTSLAETTEDRLSMLERIAGFVRDKHRELHG